MAATWTMTAALLLGAFGGRWLDRVFGTRPWLLLLGLTLGLVVGFYELSRVIMRAAGGDGGGSRSGGDGSDDRA